MGTTVSDQFVGQWLDGRYRIDARIARGGMATVYRAQDMRLDRTVALKVMHASLAEDDEFVSRFIREAKSTARLSHPNVVSVYDQGSDPSGAVFLAMEFLDGRTLRDLLIERDRLAPDEALGTMEAVLAALSAAHEAGLVHRDVKPENVLVGHDGTVKVGDFGLARATAPANHTHTSSLLLGTVAYLSPEQVAHGHADERSDVYAAGILLFELLTGRQPFDGETPIAVAYQHVNERVPAPSSLVPSLSGEVDALVVAATRREPQRRPSDAAGLLAATTGLRAGDTRALPAGTDQDTVAVPRGSNRNDTLVDPAVPPASDEPGANERFRPAHAATGGRLRTFLRRRGGALGLAGLLALALIAGYYFGWGQWTQVPSLTGMKVSAATQKATRLGFEVDRGQPRFSKTVPADHVIETGPSAGQRIREGGMITVTRSKGKPPVSVPGVQGSAAPNAKQQLRSAGLQVGEMSRAYSPSVALGHVISTDPAAGTKVATGSTVDIVRSKGVRVPDVTGQPVGAATGRLEGKGFEVEVSKRPDSDTREGIVLSQNPQGGGAERGSRVALVVSRGNPTVSVPDGIDDGIDRAGRILDWFGERDSGFPF